ncbi:unnamed protein product, partial [Choristocarpus tenellus]
MRAVQSGRVGALREIRQAMAKEKGETCNEEPDQEALGELAIVAVREGWVGCLQALTEGCKAQDVLAWRDEAGRPLIGLVIEAGEDECVEHVISLGAPLSTLCDHNENTILHLAASRSDVRLLQKLMNKASLGCAPTNLEWRNRTGDTVLMAAMRFGNLSTAEYLVKFGNPLTTAAHTFR